MKDNIFYLYKNLYKKFGISPSSVKARNAKQQYLRFKHLISLINIKKNDKILDIGCGFGDLSNHLKKNKIYCKYLGVDFIREFIQGANKLYGNKKTKFTKLDIYKDNFPGNYDWLILSGVFNDKSKNSEVLMHKLIKKMYLSSKKGIVFNGLNKYVDYEDKKLFYSYPDKILKYCINNLSKYVILKTNYQLKKNTIPFEFSVAVFKK
jgi:SAM-dependent methyltransferase